MAAPTHDPVIDSLETMNPLREPVLSEAIAALALPVGSHGLDIGCGIGLQTLQLAAATCPGERVTGLDISPDLLDYARLTIAASPYAGHITFKQGSMMSLPFKNDSFDYAWSADCAGYPAGDLLPVLREMARVVRPGGTIAVLGWTSQQILPGYAMLEARLNAACSAYAPLYAGMPPQAEFGRALHWFPQSGIADASCRTFAGQVQAPLAPEMRAALASLLGMLWQPDVAGLSNADRQQYRRLSSAESPDFILDLPEYCGFFTYTMYWGTVQKA